MEGLNVARKDRLIQRKKPVEELKLIGYFDYKLVYSHIGGFSAYYVMLCNVLLEVVEDKGLQYYIQKLQQKFAKFLEYPKLTTLETYNMQKQLVQEDKIRDVSQVGLTYTVDWDSVPETAVVVYAEENREVDKEEILALLVEVVQSFSTIEVSIVDRPEWLKSRQIYNFGSTESGLFTEIVQGYRILVSTLVYLCNSTSVREDKLLCFDELEIERQLDFVRVLWNNLPTFQ